MVVNAIVSTGLYTNPTGFHEFYMDNCYSGPEFFNMLMTRYKILECVMIWTNRKGWDQKVMNLSKSATRGHLKTF